MLLKLVASVLGVAVVASVGIGAVAVGDVVQSVKPPVALVDKNGKTVTPGVAALDGSFNVLIAGSDSGDGNAAYGKRTENLNDVTMVMHVSANHENVTVVSLPRDMLVAVPSCPDPSGGNFSAMSSQKLNVSLSYGGLACTVLTVEKLTGLEIPYAALIQFDGVVAMSDAVGGVPVCLAGPIKDPYTGLNLPAGTSTISGSTALAFLRTRHGVGDGSDLGRISNQQVFLSSLVRTIKSAGTLTNPVKVYSLAKAAASNMQLSQSLSSVATMASMAVALKSVDTSKVVFVQYPTQYVAGGGAVVPDPVAAPILNTALQDDKAVTLTGGTGLGSTVENGATGAGSTDTATTPPAAPGASDGSTATPDPNATSVALPGQVTGQTAAESTCSRPFGK